ncbi:NnrU family protein [Sedimentimonas flavescens]|uniref:NnrU family protein n=1 Tax=Sedimentimonas flavescens TaxID=2851012 RepID=UPI0021A4815C|nr:NnrU family protein [Sedimentimonas flavescens]MCT2539304.1 NnrU family protein [Sedimentimonas flavescens]
MAILILGVLLWALPHLAKRIVPGFHRNLKGAERPMVAGLVLVGVLLMVVGYRAADGAIFWGRSAPLAGINNLLMLASVYLFAAAGMQTAVARKMRHPMLSAMILWSVAHLLVNGDVPSFVLFGGLALWAVLEMVLINRAAPGWTPPKPVPAKKEAMAAIGALVVYGAIAGVHYALGYPAFG